MSSSLFKVQKVSNLNISYSLKPAYFLNKIMGIFLIPNKDKMDLISVLKDILLAFPFYMLQIITVYLTIIFKDQIEIQHLTVLSIDVVILPVYVGAKFFVIIMNRYNLRNIENSLIALVAIGLPINIFEKQRHVVFKSIGKVVFWYSCIVIIEIFVAYLSGHPNFLIFMLCYKIVGMQNGFTGLSICLYPVFLRQLFIDFNENIFSIKYTLVVKYYYYHMKLVTGCLSLYIHLHAILLLQILSHFATSITCINLVINEIKSGSGSDIDLICPCYWMISSIFWIFYIVHCFSSLGIEVNIQFCVLLIFTGLCFAWQFLFLRIYCFWLVLYFLHI